MTEPIETPEVDLDEAPQMSSSIERIRSYRQELADETTIDINVPGYHDELKISFKAIPAVEAERIMRQITKNKGAKAAKAACDLLIRCCDEILLKQDDGSFEALRTERGPIRFEPALGEAFGFSADSARNAVMGLYAPNEKRDLVVVDQANTVFNWMQGRLSELDKELLGES